jgi:hypothetical protein
MNDNLPPPDLHPGQVWRHGTSPELAIIRAIEPDYERCVTYFVLNGATRLRQRTAPASLFLGEYDACVTDLRQLLPPLPAT